MLAFLGSIAFSGKAIIVKLAYRHGVDAVTLIMYRMLFALPIFALMAWWASRGKPPLTRRDWLGVLGLGVSGYYLASFLDFAGLAYISASLERLILYLNPTLVVLLGWAMYGRVIRWGQALGMLVSYGGVLLVFGHEANLQGTGAALGTLLVFLTAPLGCLMLWRRMSFFADTMAHGTLLGVALAAVLSLPLWIGVTFTAVLLVAVLWVLHDPRLPNDALLALCSATLLCSGLLLIQHLPALRPELLSYLFGDLLTIEWSDLPMFATVIVVALAILYKNWQAQIQIAIDPDIAVSEGVNAKWQRLVFMMLLALFTVLALRAVGSLLMGALLVIPALTARLLAHSPKQMVVWAFVMAQIGVTVGLWSSAGLNISTGLSIVLTMALLFTGIFIFQKIKKIA